jgi:hypothetical protein
VLTDNGSCYRGLAHALVPPTRDPPSAHPPLSPPDKRQSRALHPHPPRRLGLRRHLPLKQRTHQSP